MLHRMGNKLGKFRFHQFRTTKCNINVHPRLEVITNGDNMEFVIFQSFSYFSTMFLTHSFTYMSFVGVFRSVSTYFDIKKGSYGCHAGIFLIYYLYSWNVWLCRFVLITSLSNLITHSPISSSQVIVQRRGMDSTWLARVYFWCI